MFYFFAPSPNGPGIALIGDITFFVTIFNVAIGIGGFRLGAAYTFFVARGAEKKPLTGTYFLFTLASFGLLSLGTFLLGYWLNWFPGILDAFALFMLVPVLEVPSTIYQNLRIAEGRTAHGQIPAMIEATVRMAFIVYFSHLWTPQSVAGAAGVTLVTEVAWAYVLGAAAGAIASVPMFREVAFRNFYATLRDMLVYATPLAAGLFLTYAGSFVVPILVRVLSGSSVVLVDFTAPNAFLILLLFVPFAVTLPLFPDLAGMHARGEDEAIRLRVRQAIRYTLMLLAPGIVVATVFRVDLLRLFYSNAVAGTSMTGGATALVFLALSALPTAVFRITGTALDAVGQQKREFWISSAQFIVLVGTVAALVGSYQAVGAAVAVLLSGIVGLALNAVYLYRFLPVRFPVRSVLTVMAASIATFALFSGTGGKSFIGVLGLQLNLSNKFLLIAVIAGGLVLYLFVLAAVGELAKQDVIDLTRTAGLPEWLGRGLSRICWRDSWAEEGHLPPRADGPS